MMRSASKKQQWRLFCPLAALLSATLLSTLVILRSLPSSGSWTRRRLLLPEFRRKPTIEPTLGRYGELMLSFLRPDLPFTLFIPEPSFFESLLQAINGRFNTSGTFSPNSTVPEEESNYAIVSRVFGFSAVPRCILSGMVPLKGEVGMESVSGFRLNVARLPLNGTLFVNNLACSVVDIQIESIVVHIVDGMLMDSEFEQSVIPFHDDLDTERGMPLVDALSV